MNKLRRTLRRRGGFTLIELLVVVLIIGILAAIAVPQYFKVVEKGKTSESLEFAAHVKGAEERYLAKYSTYTNNVAVFDTTIGNMKNFSYVINTNNSPAFNIAMTRNNNPCPAFYGCYVVTYQEPPVNNVTVTCNNTNCMADLLP